MPSGSKQAIVVIGNHTQGLGIVRSAAVTGYPIHVFYDRKICASRYSKYLSRFHFIKKNTLRNIDQQSQAEYLCNELLSLPVAAPSVLFGVNEDIIRFIHIYRDRLAPKYYIPDFELNLVFDKFDFNKLLPESFQIPTHIVSDIDVSDFGSTYILKGRQGNILRNLVGEKALVLNSKNQNQVLHAISKLPKDRLVVQKIINTTRPIFSVCTFCAGGDIRGMFMYEKLRQHPNQFGTGTYLKSTSSAELLGASKELLQRLKYTGISEIEFIFDEDSQSYRVIEMNPRTWKSVMFATQCGQNLVEKYVKFIMGEPFDTNLDYAIDKYWADLYTDIPQMLRERRIFSYKTRECFECTWSKKDPLPFFAIAFLSPLIALKV
jgi:predicted ATP-grasp superfamily ATP-dependent carboligase